MAVTILIFLQSAISNDAQSLTIENLGKVFLSFGIACLSADATVMSEKDTADPDMSLRRGIERERIDRALRIVPSETVRSTRLIRMLERLVWWFLPPSIAVFLGSVLTLGDGETLAYLGLVGIFFSLTGYYLSSSILKNRVLGKSLDLAVNLFLGICLDLVLAVSLWMDLCDENAGIAVKISAGVVCTWLAISPGLCFGIGILMTGPNCRSVVFHRVERVLRKQCAQLSPEVSPGADPLAVTAAWLSPIVPVGWILAELSRFRLYSQDDAIDQQKTRKWIWAARIVTALVLVLVALGATLALRNPQWFA